MVAKSPALFQLFFASALVAQVPHGQDRPPGPALSPAEARARMTVPEGFEVELFASEPDIVNPTAMTFDERGRIWITESLEYPRRSAGPGQDRIKVLEDTDGDGRADSFTVFAEGLNIPCGIALDRGGAYVTNSPDLLFLRDADGDLKAEGREVLLTGFGRSDTHELPNNLTWGPDGWLYGLNGVFNGSRVLHQGKEHRFDCALWRYHPRTRDFELYAEGTSNPWGLAFDSHGSFFVSACVIDHLYHLAETGYHHRQAGKYPPFTWKIESVVDHQHQKAAYCGLALYDADVYPEAYRGRLFLGNIHGNCINADRLERRGSTYVSRGEPDFLSAHDAWFMPVSIKLAPDGCFYVLDWYDRYHCYQDANRDPKGIDRLKGRLYRIAYRGSPRAGRFDLAKESSEALLRRLASPNLWWRSEARRLLAERLASKGDASLAASLGALVLEESAPRSARIQALWTLASAEDPGSKPRFLDAALHRRLLAHADPDLRAFAVRAAGNLRQVEPPVSARVAELARDPSPDVRLQAATAARKLLDEAAALPVLLEVLAASGDDPLIPRIVWRNLEPLLETRAADLARWLGAEPERATPALEPLLGRIVERVLARRDRDLDPLAALVRPLLSRRREAAGPAAECLAALARAVVQGGVPAETLPRLRRELEGPLADILAAGAGDGLYGEALSIAAAWRDPGALAEARRLVLDPQARAGWRARALEALAASKDPALIEAARAILARKEEREEFLREVLAAAGKLEGPEAGAALLAALDTLPPALGPQALDLLTGRKGWAQLLLDAVEAKRLERSALNINQVRRILALEDEGLRARVGKVWGQVRAERHPDREKVITRMRRVLDQGPGDPWKGRAVYERTCLQCHVLFGRGQAVGPDLTQNGRENLDALLSNLLDPNLVIGKDYLAWTLVEKSGRLLNGLLVEDSPRRAVLKVAGGKDEVVARKDVRSLQVSEVSLMPEDLEKNVTEAEFRDLIAYLRREEAPPEPVETRREGPEEGRRMRVEQEYGLVIVSARLPGAGGAVELFRHAHSGDGRPFIHPLRAPGGGPVLTALRPGDHPWQYGVFTGHAKVGGLDFWHEKGWIRSRGLAKVVEHADRIEIVSDAEWLTQRRGGKRVLAERQTITAEAPASPDRYAVDIEWRITPDEDVTVGKYDYGGLAFRPAEHRERRHLALAGAPISPWQDVSGVFEDGGKAAACGVAIFNHPMNPGFPHAFRVDGQGLINPAITAQRPLGLSKGQPAVFRYRLLVHRGHGDANLLQDEFRSWARVRPRESTDR